MHRLLGTLNTVEKIQGGGDKLVANSFIASEILKYMSYIVYQFKATISMSIYLSPFSTERTIHKKRLLLIMANQYVYIIELF